MSLASLLAGTEVGSLEIDNRKSIITAVARAPSGEVLVGKTALVRDDAIDVRAAFKAEPGRRRGGLQGRAGPPRGRRTARTPDVLPRRLRRARHPERRLPPAERGGRSR